MNAVFRATNSRNLRFENRRVLHRIEVTPTSGSMIVAPAQPFTDRAAQPTARGQLDANAKLRGFMVQFNLLDPPRRLETKELLVVLSQRGACHLATIRHSTHAV